MPVVLKVCCKTVESRLHGGLTCGFQIAYMRLIDACSDALVPGLTRRLLLAVLATLAPAVAASPAGAAGHPSHPPVKARPNVGIVDIYTTLGYEHGLAAGTGMIISRSGEVLTNNHVINGATKFKVVDVTTHRRYTATVAGYSVSRDIAVLQRRGQRAAGSSPSTSRSSPRTRRATPRR